MSASLPSSSDEEEEWDDPVALRAAMREAQRVVAQTKSGRAEGGDDNAALRRHYRLQRRRMRQYLGLVRAQRTGAGGVSAEKSESIDSMRAGVAKVLEAARSPSKGKENISGFRAGEKLWVHGLTGDRKSSFNGMQVTFKCDAPKVALPVTSEPDALRCIVLGPKEHAQRSYGVSLHGPNTIVLPAHNLSRSPPSAQQQQQSTSAASSEKVPGAADPASLAQILDHFSAEGRTSGFKPGQKLWVHGLAVATHFNGTQVTFVSDKPLASPTDNLRCVVRGATKSISLPATNLSRLPPFLQPPGQQTSHANTASASSTASLPPGQTAQQSNNTPPAAPAHSASSVASSGFTEGQALWVTGLVVAKHFNGRQVMFESDRPPQLPLTRLRCVVRVGPKGAKTISLPAVNLRSTAPPKPPQEVSVGGNEPAPPASSSAAPSVVVPHVPCPFSVGDQVFPRGVEIRPELNGQTVELLGHDRSRGGKWVRVKVLRTGEVVAVKHSKLAATPAHTELPGQQKYLPEELGPAPSVAHANGENKTTLYSPDRLLQACIRGEWEAANAMLDSFDELRAEAEKIPETTGPSGWQPIHFAASQVRCICVFHKLFLENGPLTPITSRVPRRQS
jgi:hypothetical protein